MDTHAKLVKHVEANKGPIDILLVGDSITQQWGSALDGKPLNAVWQKYLGKYSAINIGIGGDKTQNVLWRLDHGGVAGLEPRLVVLLIGNNNMFFAPETGVEAAAQGIKMCVANLREKFPNAPVVAVNIFPAHAPGVRFYEDIKKTNAALDALKLDSDPKVQVLDLWNDMVNADGTLKTSLFTPDNIHLSQDGGYELYASKLKPLVDKLLGGKGNAKPTAKPASAANVAPSQPTSRASSDTQPTSAAKQSAGLDYPYAPYSEGKMDPQLTGWPLTDAERKFVLKSEYTRKPGHEVSKHLPNMWPVTPTAGYWGSGEGNTRWLDNHTKLVSAVQAAKGSIGILLVGDSITQQWGGSAIDNAPFRASWQKHFGQHKTVNIGIGGDRTESVLWRLDHGAVEGASPKVVVLLIGTNNTPLVAGNGVATTDVTEAIKLCVRSLRAKCPDAELAVVKILPAFAPGNATYDSIKRINADLDALNLASDPKVHVLDLWNDFTNPDGSLKTAAYSDGHLHLSGVGYGLYAAKLKPVVDRLLAKP